MKNVINIVTVGLLLLAAGSAVGSQGMLEKKIDSIFVIASSGEVKFQHLVKPAEDSIAALGTQAVPHLADKLDTKSPRERLAVINILKKIGSPAVPYLVTALGFDKGLVVERVAWALGDIKDTSATVGLLGVAAHPRWQVREQTIGALGRIADPRGTDAVVNALDDTIPLVRKSAAVSTGQLKVTTAIGRLVHLLGDSFYGVRMTAFASLAQLDTQQVLLALVDSLESGNRMVGDLGCSLLGRLQTDSAKHVLLAQTKSEDPERRAHAAVALVIADPNDECDFRELFLAAETNRFTRLKVESAISIVTDDRSAKTQ